MADTILPGDVNPGDLITLPDADREVVVQRIQLGQCGFLLTVSVPGAGPDMERVVTLTAMTPLIRRGRFRARCPA